MTNEEILEKQVEALEKLLQLKAAVIEELEDKVRKLQSSALTSPYPVSVPSVWTIPQPSNGCIDNLGHQYPSMWGGTGPIPCTKCGAYRTYASGISGGLTFNGGAGGNAGNVYVTGGSTLTAAAQAAAQQNLPDQAYDSLSQP